jgi:hypothetical protein
MTAIVLVCVAQTVGCARAKAGDEKNPARLKAVRDFFRQRQAMRLPGIQVNTTDRPTDRPTAICAPCLSFF